MAVGVFKAACLVPVSAEVMADVSGSGGWWADIERDITTAMAEAAANGHIGPMHAPTRSMFNDVRAEQRERERFARMIHALVGTRKPGAFVRITARQ